MAHLEVLKSVDGKPMKLNFEEGLDFGSYDVYFGANLDFFLKNTTSDLIADITGLKTSNDNCILNTPAEVRPGETVKCSIKIPSVDPNSTLDDFNFASIDDVPPTYQLQGSILWRKDYYDI